MTPDDARETIVKTLIRQGLTETDLAPRSRIARPLASIAYDLPRIPFSTAPGTSVDLVRRVLLGQGGMGVVHAAEQRSLGREVAVKTVAKPDDERRCALVLEGKTMGALEHPNIVPVHALGIDDNGDPVLVMKLVDGVSWRALLDDPNHPWWSTTIAPHHDRLRANVEILMSVCRALSFAHSRGVIHRDLKPDNVMLGRFGEVYLLDWGIAFRLDERTAEGTCVVGTPGYLAPEMARGDPRALDERTDVYLLGATLFELLAGRPPHGGTTPIAALVSSLMGEIPSLPETAPADLASLARAALASDPERRPASAEAFRHALSEHLASSAASRLIRAADDAIARADAAVAREGAASTSAYRSLVEARFALRSALELRPGDAPALERSDACVRRMCERELALSSPLAARELAAELTKPDAALVARIDRLDDTIAAERATAEHARKMVAQSDISSAWKVLAATCAVMVVVSIASTIRHEAGRVALDRFTPPPIDERARFWAVVLFVLAVILVLARRRLFATIGSRRLTLGLVLMTIAQPVIIWVCFFTGAPVPVFALWLAHAMVTAAVANTVLPGVWPVALLMLPCAIVFAVHPEIEVPVTLGMTPILIGCVAAALRTRHRTLLSSGIDLGPGSPSQATDARLRF